MSCLEVNRMSTINDLPNENKGSLESEITEFMANAKNPTSLESNAKPKKINKEEFINFSSIVTEKNSNSVDFSPMRSLNNKKPNVNRIFSSNASRNSTNLMEKVNNLHKSPFRCPEKVLRTYSPFTKTSSESE